MNPKQDLLVRTNIMTMDEEERTARLDMASVIRVNVEVGRLSRWEMAEVLEHAAQDLRRADFWNTLRNDDALCRIAGVAYRASYHVDSAPISKAAPSSFADPISYMEVQ